MHFAHDKKPGSSPDPPKSGPGVPESGPPLARGKHIFVGGVDRFVPGPRRASYSDECYQNNTYGMFTQLVVYAQSPLKLGLCRDVISLITPGMCSCVIRPTHVVAPLEIMHSARSDWARAHMLSVREFPRSSDGRYRSHNYPGVIAATSTENLYETA